MGIKNKKQPTTNQKTTEKKPEKQPYKKEYVRDLLGRISWLGGSVIVAAIIGFEFKDIIQGLMTMQLGDLNLVNLQPADDMRSTLQISLVAAVFAGLPLGFYHVYRFLEPVFNRGTSYAAKLLGASSLLVAAATAYAFMMTIPLVLHGTIAYGQDALAAHYGTQPFLDFAVSNLLVVVVLFQLPLAIIFGSSVQSFSKKKFNLLQLAVVPLVLAAAWFATPFTTMNRGIAGIALIAAPALVLFEASMLWAKKHAKQQPAAQTVEKAAPAPAPAPQKLAEQLPAEQPATKPVPQPAHAFVAPKTVLETEQLEPFPDEMFDAMLQDKDDIFEADHTYAPLPSSLEVIDEESAPAAPAPSVQAAPRAVAPTPIQQRPAPTPQPVQIQQKPVFRPQITPVAAAPTPAPRFAASFNAAPKLQPQPLYQPQPMPKRVVYSRQITETLKPQQTSTPPLRSLNTPQPVVPFQMRPIQPYGNTIEGLLPA